MENANYDLSQLPVWPNNAGEALKIQNLLRHRVALHNDFGKLELVAGVDCSYDIKSNLSYAFITVMKLDELKPLEFVKANLPTEFPYISGFLSFREIPVILKALAKLSLKPDFFMVDGQGIAHPRRFGIASHLGVITNLPSIGVAKSRLCGKFSAPGDLKGSHSSLTDKGEIIGYALRSKERTKPLFISPGHKFDLGTALEITIKTLRKHRLPEPTRLADKISKSGKNDSDSQTAQEKLFQSY